jgi:hypothetical protein
MHSSNGSEGTEQYTGDHGKRKTAQYEVTVVEPRMYLPIDQQFTGPRKVVNDIKLLDAAAADPYFASECTRA